MADQIVVLSGARVAEVGTHEALMAKGGQYPELYGIQTAAYRHGQNADDTKRPNNGELPVDVAAP